MTPEATFRTIMEKMSKLKSNMSTMNENVENMQDDLKKHEVECVRRNSVFNQMLNEINYRVLEIKTLGKVDGPDVPESKDVVNEEG